MNPLLLSSSTSLLASRVSIVVNTAPYKETSMSVIRLSLICALSYAVSLSPSYAISLDDVIGNASSTDISNPLDQRIDSIAGEGTSDMLNGAVSPEVALAGKQLGIPAEYYPQLQQLYDRYRGDGSVTAKDVMAQDGLSGWLSDTPDMDAGSLANNLSAIFSQ